jgi:DNA-binding NarL/FixJ family response regulator
MKVTISLCNTNLEQLLQLKSHLENSPKYNVKHSLCCGIDLLKTLSDTHSDVVIINYQLPILKGIDVFHLLKTNNYLGKVILVSNHYLEHLPAKCKSFGINAFCKNDLYEIKNVLDKITEGYDFFDEAYYIDWQKKQTVAIKTEIPFELNNKEIRVVKLVSCGLISSEIAAVLGNSIATIDVMKSKILQKLSLKNSAQLSSWAALHGLVTNTDLEYSISKKANYLF